MVWLCRNDLPWECWESVTTPSSWLLSLLSSLDKQIDLSTVDLKKLRVKELKKILDDWGESCKGCAEKSDFIRKINELMPKYAPKAASSRTDL